MRDQRCSGDVAEEWRDVVGYEGLYQVSNLGRVRSLLKNEPRILKSIVQKNGYCAVSLRRDGKGTRFYVHRIVASAFYPNPDGFPVVNHIDGNKRNNNASNLEWCSYSHNARHAEDTGLHDSSVWYKASHKAHRKKVIRDDGLVFDSVNDAAASVGADPKNVSACLVGRRKKAKGHSFSYFKESA